MTEVPMGDAQMNDAVEKLARQIHEYALEHIVKNGTVHFPPRPLTKQDEFDEQKPIIRDRYRHVARRLLEAK